MQVYGLVGQTEEGISYIREHEIWTELSITIFHFMLNGYIVKYMYDTWEDMKISNQSTCLVKKNLILNTP